MDPSAETIVLPSAPLGGTAKGIDAPLAEPKPEPVFCLSCNYDLLGIDAEGRCPECGFAVAESLKPEVRGFAGLLALRRFRLGLWLLAFMPMVVIGSMVLRYSADARRVIIDFVIGPAPSWQQNLAAAQAHWQLAEVIDQRLLLATGIVIPPAIALPLLLVVWRGRRTRHLTQCMVERPQLISSRTGAIAFGSIIAMSMIPIASVPVISEFMPIVVHTTIGFMPIVLIWIATGILTWWLVSQIISGQVRIAFVIAGVMLAIAVIYPIAPKFSLWRYEDIFVTLAISAMTLLTLGSGLLWRWISKGFRMSFLTSAATIYAALAPVMVAVGYNSLAETFSSTVFSLPAGIALATLASAAGFAALLGTAIGWNLFRIRRAQR